MYCWGFGWFSSFYYSSDYHLLFLNGICYYGIQGVCPSEETLLQQPWCSLPVACRGDSDDPLEFGGSQPPFAQFVIHKGSLKAGSRHRSCTGNGFPPGAAEVGLRAGFHQCHQTGSSPPGSCCCSPQILLRGSILFSLSIPPLSICGQAALAQPQVCSRRFSWNYRIMGWFGLQGSLKTSWVFVVFFYKALQSFRITESENILSWDPQGPRSPTPGWF